MEKIEKALAAFKDGHFVIVVDDEDRENEGDFIVAAERECFDNPWDETAVRAVTDSEYGGCVCEEGTGYALGRLSFDEAELYRIAVLPSARGKSAGRRLLTRFVAECRERGAEKIFLEVRSRNVPAILLYEHTDFEKISVRRGYYPDDDGIVYILAL